MLLESRCKLLFGDESPARLHLADDAAEEDAGEAHHDDAVDLKRKSQSELGEERERKGAEEQRRPGKGGGKGGKGEG